MYFYFQLLGSLSCYKCHLLAGNGEPPQRLLSESRRRRKWRSQGHAQCVINISDPDPWPQSIPIMLSWSMSTSPHSFPPSTPLHTALLFIFFLTQHLHAFLFQKCLGFCQHRDKRISYFLSDTEKRWASDPAEFLGGNLYPPGVTQGEVFS